MKKLTYLFLALLIFACSDDDDNSCDVSNASLVGVWIGDFNDPQDGVITYVIDFLADGTGNIDSSSSSPSSFDYTSTDSEVTMTISSDLIIIFNYQFVTCDQVNMYVTPDPGEEANIIVFNRN
tara:strand:+ start:101 stop:469 length:369 start_codon:yes stop_codon:yes gene_type:complete